jgi:hypothetical protein
VRERRGRSNRAAPDHVVPLADMPALLHGLAQQPAGEPVPEAAAE